MQRGARAWGVGALGGTRPDAQGPPEPWELSWECVGGAQVGGRNSAARGASRNCTGLAAAAAEVHLWGGLWRRQALRAQGAWAFQLPFLLSIHAMPPSARVRPAPAAGRAAAATAATGGAQRGPSAASDTPSHAQGAGHQAGVSPAAAPRACRHPCLCLRHLCPSAALTLTQTPMSPAQTLVSERRPATTRHTCLQHRHRCLSAAQGGAQTPMSL